MPPTRIFLRVGGSCCASGINPGDVLVEGSDLCGNEANVAARFEAAAEPGTVFVSQTVYSHVRGKVQLGFDDLGE
jgi:adenylate cyclase